MKRAVWIVAFLLVWMIANWNVSKCSGIEHCFKQEPLMTLMWLFVCWYLVYQVWKQIWIALDNNEVIKEAAKKDEKAEKTEKAKKEKNK